MKKTALIILSIPIFFTLLSACASRGFDENSEITVITREDGSGTRSAFIELFGIEEKDANGNNIDLSKDSADQTQSTGVMLTSVSSNPNAIGYVSFGSLNDSIKTVKIDGIAPTGANIKSGSYKICRPFNIATKDNLSPLAEDFINYAVSRDSKEVVEKNGYIFAGEDIVFSSLKPSGKLTIAGSSSVSPVMEKLKEAYLVINPNASIEITQSDSTMGINNVSEGICDIAMASRDLKESEINRGLSVRVIAIDGLAVIVNHENPIDNMTSEDVRAIYTGDAVTWSDILNNYE